MANNLIILPGRINNSDTLYFILDTGLKTSILSELDRDETLDLEQAREIRLMGLGKGSPAEAIHSAGNELEVGGMVFRDQDFIILSSNVLGLSRKMGTRIHGILSMQAFYGFIVEIDYERKILSLIPPDKFNPAARDKFAAVPMQMESGKPFLVVTLIRNDGKTYPVKLLLDSGASNALWLDTGTLGDYTVPETSRYCHLGCGISGDVQGLISRVKRVMIGPYELENVLVSYPDSIAIARQEPVTGRNGSLGSEILKRFTLVLDFPGRFIYLRPNKAFHQEFHHDMSGMEVMAEVPDRPGYIVSRVREGSPAWIAGIRTGDRILTINNSPVHRLSLDDIYRNLAGTPGRKVRMVILRGEEKLKFSFRLEEYV
jgi:hypothetical protein